MEETSSSNLEDPVQNTFRKASPEVNDDAVIVMMANGYRQILECVNSDMSTEELEKTAESAAKTMRFLTRGYKDTVEIALGEATFADDHDEVVVVRDVEMSSLCEHHLLPFYGTVSVGYLPNGKIIGLSKIARIIEVYTRRLQVQERLTRQIAQAINDAINPAGVGVIVQARHMCMAIRGVNKTKCTTITSSMTGVLRDDPKRRGEFLALVKTT